mgnify:CR=1 FL=1
MIRFILLVWHWAIDVQAVWQFSYVYNIDIFRNENIIGSSHPWKAKIIASLGSTKSLRRKNLMKHYENAKKVYGKNYWMGDKNYNREKDLFFKRFLTVLNNGK